MKRYLLEPNHPGELAALRGALDAHMTYIEKLCNVRLRLRGEHVEIMAEPEPAAHAWRVIQACFAAIQSGQALRLEDVHNWVVGLKESPSPAVIPIRTHQRVIEPRTPTQCLYVERLRQYDLNLGVGPAGTGKTFLAVAMAVEALLSEQVERLVLVRPAVEAGEKLGFLPGDMAQKVDPYLRPIFDALHVCLGASLVQRLLDEQRLEIAPLAFMRGRTLSQAFIILDEAQNATREQLKMFLTRIGFGSKAVITGDLSQVDLPKASLSGLKEAIALLKPIPNVAITAFEAHDVMRHPLVQAIVMAYDQLEAQAGS